MYFLYVKGILNVAFLQVMLVHVTFTGICLEISVQSGSETVDSYIPISALESSLSSNGSSDDGSDEGIVQHKLCFKCIGAPHEKPGQLFLQEAEWKLHEEQFPVKVKLRPEPTNEKDRSAIAIDMDCGNGWFHVGYMYIASELTLYIQPLIENNKILDVSVEHLIFRVYWAKMGFYPLISITRKGQWEKYVTYRCRSAR